VRRLCSTLLLATAAWGQGHRHFLTEAFAQEGIPGLTLTLANRPVEVKARLAGTMTLTAPGSEATLEARLSREGPFEYCRIRPAADSSLAPEELKLQWSLPMA
jgi:hypothetical protein